jgi:uncharacterized protein GlcG (DUF336 family)
MLRQTILGFIALSAVATYSQAQPAPAAAPDQGAPPAAARVRPPPDPRYVEAPRAVAPSLALALEAATTAVGECKTRGYKCTVQVTDAANEPVVLLSGDGAGMRSLHLMKPKPVSVYMHKTASSNAREEAKTDPQLADLIKGDSAITFGGALPIMVNGEMVGVITVSGTPNGTIDEACGQAGLDKIAARLKMPDGVVRP